MFISSKSYFDLSRCSTLMTTNFNLIERAISLRPVRVCLNEKCKLFEKSTCMLLKVNLKTAIFKEYTTDNELIPIRKWGYIITHTNFYSIIHETKKMLCYFVLSQNGETFN